MKDGKLHHRSPDLTGQIFGMLTAIRAGTSDGRKRKWVYRCECGVECEKVGTDVKKGVKSGRTPNCGCAVNRLIGEKNTKHGMSRHPAYAVYRSMLDRCRLPSHQSWHNYGGRGITVCARWQLGFAEFWEDMGPAYQHGRELDRRDNNRGYTPANCRWTTTKVNANNRRGNVRVASELGLMPIAELSRLSGINETTIAYRVAHSWPKDKLLIPANFHNRYPYTTS